MVPYVKYIAIFALTFFEYIILVLASVYRFKILFPLETLFIWKIFVAHVCLPFFFLLWFVNAGPNQYYNSSAGPMAAPTRSNCALRAKQEHREPSPICCSTEGMVVGSRRHGFAALWARSTKNVKKPERQMCEPCRIARFKTFAKQNRNLFSFSPTFDS